MLFAVKDNSKNKGPFMFVCLFDFKGKINLRPKYQGHLSPYHEVALRAFDFQMLKSL